MQKYQKFLYKIVVVLLTLSSLIAWIIIHNKTVATSQPKSPPIPLYTDFQLIIPKISVNAPVIADVNGSDKVAYFKALENGVAHFQGTAKPGEKSNIFIFGHSSFYADSPGSYKEVFKNLEKLEIGDEIILWYRQKEYKYKVIASKVVNPDEVEVLKPTSSEQVSLMTCVPPGTTLKRLVVIATPTKP